MHWSWNVNARNIFKQATDIVIQWMLSAFYVNSGNQIQWNFTYQHKFVDLMVHFAQIEKKMENGNVFLNIGK